MKSIIVVLLIVISPNFIFAQKDNAQSKKSEMNKTDSLQKKFSINPVLPPRELIIRLKDMKEIKDLRNSFRVIDDTCNCTDEELKSGLSKDQLGNYKKNKEKIKQLLTPPPSEEETYPTIWTIRKILGVAKTAGVIIILILSLL